LCILAYSVFLWFIQKENVRAKNYLNAFANFESSEIKDARIGIDASKIFFGSALITSGGKKSNKKTDFRKNVHTEYALGFS
jgi:hypothetical protein